jgi:hypothetical protein
VLDHRSRPLLQKLYPISDQATKGGYRTAFHALKRDALAGFTEAVGHGTAVQRAFRARLAARIDASQCIDLCLVECREVLTWIISLYF